MPTVSLTPQQQAQVDAANELLATHQKAYTAAKANEDSSYGKLKSIYDSFKADNCNYPFQPSLEAQLSNYGALNSKSCGGKLGCGKDKCQSYVGDFNQQRAAWLDRKRFTEQILSRVNDAKSNLNAILDAIAKDPTVAANTSIINNQIDAAASKDRINRIFFGLAAVLVIGVAIWIGVRMLKGGSSA